MERNFANGFDNTLPREMAHHLKHESQMSVEASLPTNGKAENEKYIAAVDHFVCQVASAVEFDYGDWMRRVNSYWLELDLVLHGIKGRVPQLMERMQLIVQFEPDWKLTETRRCVVELAVEIRRELGAESAPDLHAYGLSERSSRG